MTPRNMRALAEALDNNFMTDADRRGWANDLRGHAKGLERQRDEEPHRGGSGAAPALAKARGETDAG